MVQCATFLLLLYLPATVAVSQSAQGAVTVDTGSVVLRFAGDLLLGGHYEEAAKKDVSMAFEGFTLLRDADMAMVNLENPITTRGEKTSKPFNFRMHPRFLAALKSGGIGVVNLANNHIFDFGKEGLFDTISYLDSIGIRHVGAGINLEEAERPVLLNLRGIRVGVCGYHSGGEAPAATSSRPGVAPRHLERIRKDLAHLRQRDSADIVVVNLHWGTEGDSVPSQGQRAFARQVIDAGADAVVGHHTHVLQGIERYKKGVIAYSLGNFVFGGNSRNTYGTGVFEIHFSRRETTYHFIPVGVRKWHMVVLTGAERERALGKMSDLSRIFHSTIF